MDVEQHYEWQRLREMALAELRGRRSADELLRLLVVPAATAPHLYIVARTDSGRDGQGVLRTWDLDLDRGKFTSPGERLRWPRELTPTLRSRQCSLPAPGVAGVAAALRDLRLPPDPGPSAVAVDGTGYELSCGGSSHLATFSWWVQPPKAWAPLAPLVAVVERLFAASAP